MGEDALSGVAVSTSKWDAAEYAKVGAFVAELGGAALDLLDPQPGERILDVGCGEGTLTKKIIERGATVLGIDNSPEMIGAARANGSIRKRPSRRGCRNTVSRVWSGWRAVRCSTAGTPGSRRAAPTTGRISCRTTSVTGRISSG